MDENTEPGLTPTAGYQYEGQELDVFALATNWKAYWLETIRLFLQGRVLEVGSGIGSNLRGLCDAGATSLTCLEPDAAQVARLKERIAAEGLEGRVQAVVGDLNALNPRELYDVIVYIDVLEHIADDTGEIARATPHLAPGGSLIVLSPAFPFLFSPFDAAIGHHRRYTRQSLRQVAEDMPDLQLQRLVYLDCLGFASSCANRFFLNQSAPRVEQIQLWDKKLVPISRVLDPLICHTIGKSVIGIWRKIPAGQTT